MHNLLGVLEGDFYIELSEYVKEINAYNMQAILKDKLHSIKGQPILQLHAIQHIISTPYRAS